MIYEVKDTKQVKHLFENWEESMVWSCMQGIMGHVYAKNTEVPLSAMAFLGDFIFFAGKPSKELVLFKPDCCQHDFVIMVPQNDKWGELMQNCYGEAARKIERYAIKKEPDVFDREKLKGVVRTLPADFELKMVDEELYLKCREESWCQDLVSQYKDYGSYQRLGLGAVILKDGEIVSGASSYSAYRDGIEIEIDTKEPYRRKGLASVCGAKLILECLDRKLYPSWDAQNMWSVALAEKLGYHYSHTYTAYEISGY